MTVDESIITTFHALLFSLGPGLPLLMALGCCLPKVRKASCLLFPLAALPALLIPFIVPRDLVVEVPWFFMGGRMGLDAFGQVFLWAAAFIWFAAGLAAREQLGSPRFVGSFLAAMAGNFGLVLAQDTLGFYLFFALMSFSAVGMVAHRNTPEARRAGRIYLVLVMIGEVAMFAALAFLSERAHSIAIADLAGVPFHPAALILLLVGFGVKIGALPFHVWMPSAYQETPIPGSAALAGAMVNAGLLGWLRFLPLGQVALPEGALVMTAAGSLAALYGVAVGLGQSRPQTVLAYSSISQMGLMTMIVGLGLADPATGRLAASVLTVYAVHHGLAKASLFLGSDLVNNRNGRSRGWFIAGLLLPGLALAGLPLTSGAIAKTGFKELAVTLGPPWSGWCGFFLPLASVGTTVLVLHFLRLVLRAPSADASPCGTKWRAWFLSLAGVALVMWLWPAARGMALHSLVPAKLWQGGWPVATGVLLFLAWHWSIRGRATPYRVPEGDVLVLLEQCIGHVRPGLFQAWRKPVSVMEQNLTQQWRRAVHAVAGAPYLFRTENVLRRWGVVGSLFLLLWGLLLFLLYR